MRRIPYYVLLTLAMIGAMGLSYSVVRTEKVFAATDAASCKAEATMGGVGTGGVPAVSNACDYCYGDADRVPRGTLWMSNQGPGIALVIADRTLGGRDTTATFNVHGQVFSCGNGSARSYTAHNVSLQDSAGTAIPQLTTIGDVPRGSTSAAYTWSEGGTTSGHKITDLDGFFATESTCTDLGLGAKECTRIVQVYRCFSPGAGCYADPSTVRAVINDTTDDTTKNRFASKSSVEIPAVAGTDITSNYSATSGEDGSARVEISTDETSVKVKFKHAIYYKVTSAFGAGDTVATPSANWKIRTKVGEKSGWAGLGWMDKTGTGSSGTWTASSGKTSGDSGFTIGEEEVTVNFTAAESGKEKRICRRVVYEKRLVGFVVSGWNGSGWNWTIEDASSSGFGNSDACAYITYISTDEDKDPLAKADVAMGTSAGADAMLAGEDAELKISGQAAGIMTRRLIGKEAVVFNHAASTPHDPALVASASRFKGTQLCKLFTDERTPPPLDCKKLTKYSADFPAEAEAGATGSDVTEKSAAVAVMDDIGQKYCNSFGYKFRYFYGIMTGGATSSTFTSEPAKDYTFVAQPACQTIAKKPTMAAWNGGVATNGGDPTTHDGIVTSLAKRHVIGAAKEGPKLGYTKPAGSTQLETADEVPVADDARDLYGSWAEYLTVTQNGMEKTRAMGSGSTLSQGAGLTALSDTICHKASEPWTTNSPLTISNVNCNLNDGIGTSVSTSAFRTRLAAYLKNAPSVSGVTIKNMGMGDLTIDNTNKSEFVNADVNYNGIRALPQTIIFANNVKISGDVERIDAWIIADGTVNTCVEYNKDTNGNGSIDLDERTTSDGVGVDGNACAKQLVFNGPVVAKKILLNRTFGANSQPHTRTGWRTNGTSDVSLRQSSAEIFNLRADTYLWAYVQASRYNSSYNTVYSRELAPRY